MALNYLNPRSSPPKYIIDKKKFCQKADNDVEKKDILGK